ncbi:MAG: LacI family transcriptional regulator [Hymenobacter sp.]|nr:MAG: LacI family transcriptional regulator [Hymenobacter sp.]
MGSFTGRRLPWLAGPRWCSPAPPCPRPWPCATPGPITPSATSTTGRACRPRPFAPMRPPARPAAPDLYVCNLKKRTLLQDIARQLDVSIATVSLVLNGKAKEHRISDALAERVRRHVAQVGYRPNQLAKSLRTGKTHVIGLIIEDISNPFFATVAWLIEKQAFARGYRILYGSTDNDPAKTRDLLTMFRERHLDGYIIAPPAGVEKEIEALLKSEIPTVLFDRYLPALPTDYIVVDGEAGAYQATAHLLAQGFTRVAFVSTESVQTQMNARLHGYQRALRERGLPPLVRRVPLALGGHHAPSVAELCRFLAEYPDCDAALFANNSLTICALEAVAELGLRIPQDLAIVSFDDNDLFRLYSPAITAVTQPVAALAEAAITVLLNQLGNAAAAERQQLTLPVSLLVRQSSRRVA